MSTSVEGCANCGRPIGKLETPHIWAEKVVCSECAARLGTAHARYGANERHPPAPAVAMRRDTTTIIGQWGRWGRGKRVFAIGFVVLGVGWCALCGSGLIDDVRLRRGSPHSAGDQPAADAADAGSPIDKSPAKQAVLADGIAELQREGYVYKIVTPSPGSVEVWATAGFEALPFDTKREILSSIYFYYMRGIKPGNVVNVIDNTTGKKVGEFSEAGLSWD